MKFDDIIKEIDIKSAVKSEDSLNEAFDDGEQFRKMIDNSLSRKSKLLTEAMLNWLEVRSKDKKNTDPPPSDVVKEWSVLAFDGGVQSVGLFQS
jgi:hypothetical protein